MASNNKQSFLEKKAIDERHKEIVRSEYNKSIEYSESHENAISNPDDERSYKGKGTKNGGHQAYVPDLNKSQTSYNYSSLDTSKGGGAYDIYGRNGQGGRDRLVKINIYNSENAYGPDSVDTSSNIEDGQYVIKG
jgi:hypothetical protein